MKPILRRDRQSGSKRSAQGWRAHRASRSSNGPNARACPEQAHRKRLLWMKEHHGLGQNHASIVLDAAFPLAAGWSEPEDLAKKLWNDPQSAQLFSMIKDDLLFQRLSVSTIGADWFHGRVRDGIGWGTDAMVTKQ